ncbi:MAG: transcription-repair coupling factor [Bacteroidetes bacterium]|nr:transcription-repair coupling factor [Bacteroidota bacterium]
MKAEAFLDLFKEGSGIKLLVEGIRTRRPSTIRLKGISGSLDAVVIATSSQSIHHSHLVICQDREEAAYLAYDLQNLLPARQVLTFPLSYRKPYEFDEVENANVLMRAEVLDKLQAHPQSQLMVTYPEALSEKVITRAGMVKNTFAVKLRDTLDREFLTEFLQSYDFEKTDMVSEAGQFAIRGGIIDVFSFAHELPVRIELFGKEVDSIRSFDPGTQLSVQTMEQVRLIPDVQTRLFQEQRESLISFLPPHTCLWIKDVAMTADVMETCFEKASGEFDRIVKVSGTSSVALKPEQLFESGREFKKSISEVQVIEFGKRRVSTSRECLDIEFNSAPQPPFKKDFERLAADLLGHQQNGFKNLIAAEWPRQQERLAEIFSEIHPELRFQPLEISLREGFADQETAVLVYTDHQIFERFHRYRTREKFSKSKALTLRELQSLQPGDFVTHIDFGIAKFAGLEKREVDGRQQEAIRLVYRDDDLLYVSVHALQKISRYTGNEGTPPLVSKLGTGEWEGKKAKVRKKVKDIARELITLYAKRKQATGHAYAADSFLQAELESSFIYEDTPDQAKATEDVKKDMEAPHPMDRLVCGDVGFGKTEVAIRAAFKAINDGKQVAVLVPTTILAMQHHRTFMERLSAFPVRVEYLSRFKTDKEIKAILKDLSEGKVNILIGTHRIVAKDVVFQQLGLLIIDEEQKFGVKVKDRLKELRVNIDVLTLTATPIPRTLHFSLMGARDLSIIATPPPNRQPVTTELHTFHENIIRDAVMREMKRSGQVFFVHNRVSDIDEIANLIYRMVPDARIGIAHGQMEGDKLEKAMVRFIEGAYDVLVSTNIIESGLDIPNANTIIINQAHMFGLSDLHQMRGRVGRSNRKAYCILLTPPSALLTSDSRKRLAALEEFSELGDGFKVAMRDLDIRGAGNLLGAEQSGFITDLGYEAYHKILDDAVQELKEEEFSELFSNELMSAARELAKDCLIETDLEILIPDDYVSNVSERLQLYSRLDNLKDENQLVEFLGGLADRFGPVPTAVQDLVETVRIRQKGKELGFQKIVLKGGKLKGYFIQHDSYFRSESFNRVFRYAGAHSKRVRLKETSGQPMVVIDAVGDVRAASQIMNDLKGAPIQA